MVYTGSPEKPTKARVGGGLCSPVAAGFGLVNNMFGKEQLTSLADFVQGSLMLRYNKRNVG